MLADAVRDPKAGAKAAGLARLADAGFDVPEAFVISADCYRAHLWATGARALAVHAAEAEEREQLRGAIIRSAMPDDVQAAIIAAYEALCRRCGCADMAVAVRASGVEGGARRVDLPGAYETYLNVSGPDALLAAVKRVWASTWGGKAAAYRARLAGKTEPAMAVVVQRLVTAERAGMAATAHPVTGDPHKVLVSCGTISEDALPVHYSFDLQTAAMASSAPSADIELAALVAERAILIEENLGGPIEVEWASEGGRLWFLQSRSLTDLSPFFPVRLPREGDAKLIWRRATPRPISRFAESLLRGAGSGPSVAWMSRAEPVNGFVYVHTPEASEPRGRWRAGRARRREIAVGLRGLREWEDAFPALLQRARALVRRDVCSMDWEALRTMLADGAEAARLALQWRLNASYPSSRFPDLLRECLCGLSGLSAIDQTFAALLGPGSALEFERDSRIQDMAIRLIAAESAGKLDDGVWWPEFRQEADGLAREYGYCYHAESDVYDLASWTSWVEDREAVLREVAAFRDRDGATVITRRLDAEAMAMEAESWVLARLRGRSRSGFVNLLRLSRGWLSVQADAGLICALAHSGVRLVLMEMVGRLVAQGVLLRHDDVFHLELDELLSLPVKPSSPDRAAIATKIASRKHEAWLRSRFAAPEDLSADGQF